MQTDHRNMILAIVLSMVVLFGWQYFIAGPQLEQAQRQAELAQQQQIEDTGLATPATPGETVAPERAAGVFATRDQAIRATPRVTINTPAIAGSINLTGARIDDLKLKQYQETVDPDSPIITLLSPAGAPGGYYAEQGWVPVPGSQHTNLPTANTQWTLESGDTLTDDRPIVLSWDNGQGLVFRRTIAVDTHYLFTVKQQVENRTGGDVALYPYARVVRQGHGQLQNFFIQHEGPVGVLSTHNLVSKSYGDLEDGRQLDYASTGGWLGITDKYWATAVLSTPETPLNARFSSTQDSNVTTYQTSFVESTPVVVAAGATAEATSYVFAGAKETYVIDSYDRDYGFDRLELLIDWGWFHFITRPLFDLIQFLYGILGNFGLAILAVTVIVKAVFFPLANRSYASMAAMRRVQPEMKAIQENFKDNRAEMQKAMMELYKKEKINPLSGCWPVLIQIPVFFALYTVIFISLEMRHAPFFGWVQDLAAPDPTNIFTLFGLIPWDPTVIPLIGAFLHLGIWPILMGLTMWVQMRLNPPPTGPNAEMQVAIFNWMPVLFTFMLGMFPAGLVIYWAWNNFLSILQQYFIMKRHGVEVDLIGNIVSSFKRKPKAKPAE